MPPRDPNLPEGTDSIIDGTSDLPGSTGGYGTAGSGMGSASGMGSGSGLGSISSMGAGSSGFDDFDTPKSTGSITDSGLGSSSSSVGSTASAMNQAAGGQVQSLKAQATDKVRDVATQGKDRATEALSSVSQMVNETAETVSERLGPQYGDYVRRAADAIDGFGDQIRTKEIDELFDDARNLVRKSPGIAIGAAAAIGFLLVRLVKSGMPQNVGSDNDAGSDYGTGTGYAGSSTPQLGSPPRVDNSYDPVA